MQKPKKADSTTEKTEKKYIETNKWNAHIEYKRNKESEKNEVQFEKGIFTIETKAKSERERSEIRNKKRESKTTSIAKTSFSARNSPTQSTESTEFSALY